MAATVIGRVTTTHCELHCRACGATEIAPRDGVHVSLESQLFVAAHRQPYLMAIRVAVNGLDAGWVRATD